MDTDRMLHDLIVNRLRSKYAREYKGVTVNPGGLPDLVLADHGLTVANVQVETEKGITSERAAKWKELAASGTKLILMVPKHKKVQVLDLLWQHGIADRIAVGSYDIVIMPP